MKNELKYKCIHTHELSHQTATDVILKEICAKMIEKHEKKVEYNNISFFGIINHINNFDEEQTILFFAKNFERTRTYANALKNSCSKYPELSAIMMSFILYYNNMDDEYCNDKISEKEFELVNLELKKKANMWKQFVNADVLKRYIIEKLFQI